MNDPSKMVHRSTAGEKDIFVTGYHDGVVDMIVNENADFEKIIFKIQSRYESGQYAGKSLEDYIAHAVLKKDIQRCEKKFY